MLCVCCVIHDITLHAECVHILCQSIPSIQSVGDSNSDDEEEDLVFSGLNTDTDEVGVTKNLLLRKGL